MDFIALGVVMQYARMHYLSGIVLRCRVLLQAVPGEARKEVRVGEGDLFADCGKDKYPHGGVRNFRPAFRSPSPSLLTQNRCFAMAQSIILTFCHAVRCGSVMLAGPL